MAKMIRGSVLSRRYRVITSSSYANEKGEWYQRPDNYPATFWDLHGYITFPTERDLERFASVQIKVNFPKDHGISCHPNYRRVSDIPLR